MIGITANLHQRNAMNFSGNRDKFRCQHRGHKQDTVNLELVSQRHRCAGIFFIGDVNYQRHVAAILQLASHFVKQQHHVGIA
ncbi:Uncharacterised protein [Klebsiella oxytoca]|nr:Uncharacterised protein [Klebsiella oxytoca]